MSDRKAGILKRGVIDPIRADTRPLCEIMDDYIPYGRWAMEAYLRRCRMTKMEEYTTNANSMVADLLDWYECMPGEYPNLDHDMLAKLALLLMVK